MLVNKLKDIMDERKLSIQDVQYGTRLARNTVANLYEQKAKGIDFETINKLCKFLECNVLDILEFIPDKAS